MSLQIRAFLHNNSFRLNSARRMRSKSVLDIKINVILIPCSLLQVSFYQRLDFLTTCSCCRQRVSNIKIVITLKLSRNITGDWKYFLFKMASRVVDPDKLNEQVIYHTPYS